jgi:uncharacterized cupin superfamily protein
MKRVHRGSRVQNTFTISPEIRAQAHHLSNHERIPLITLCVHSEELAEAIDFEVVEV